MDESDSIQCIPAGISGLTMVEFEDGFASVDFGQYGVVRVSEKDVVRHVPPPTILSVTV